MAQSDLLSCSYRERNLVHFLSYYVFTETNDKIKQERHNRILCLGTVTELFTEINNNNNNNNNNNI